MKKITLVLSILLIFVFSIYSQDKQKTAPDFKLKDMKGKKVSLEKVLEKGPVLIDFWASWCDPCKEEMPIFEELYKKYNKKGLQMLLISVDKRGGISKAKNYITSKGYTFDVLFDRGSKVFKKYGGKASIPVTYIVNKEGKITYSHTGKGTKKEFEEEILKVLKSK